MTEVGSPPGLAAGSGIHRRLVGNSFSNLGRYGVGFAVAFLLTPFVVRTLGDSLYGFWIVFLSIVGYAGMLELGIQPAVVKLVAEIQGEGERERLLDLTGTALLFFLGVGCLAALVGFVLLYFFSHELIRSVPVFPRRELVYALIALDVVLYFQNVFFTGILYGRQRYHQKNLVDVSAQLLNAGLLFLFLSRGGMLALVGAKTATDALALIATVALSRRALPGVGRLPRAERGRHLRTLFSFGGRVFISATASRVASNSYPLIIGNRISASATTYFAIPSRLVDYAKEIGWALSAGFMPAFSELAGRGEARLLRDIYSRYSRYILLATMPLYVLLLVYGPAFIGLWIGPEYAERGRVVVYLLAGASAIEGLQPLLWRLLIGVGRLQVVALLSAAMSALAIVLGFALVNGMGIDGVALGILVAAVGAQVSMGLYASRYFGMSFLSMVAHIQLRPLLTGAVLYAACRGLSLWLGVTSYGSLLAAGLLALLLHGVLTWSIGLHSAERAWLWRRMRKA